MEKMKLQKVTLCLPQGLLQQALDVTGLGITATICEALEQLIKVQTYQKIVKFRSKVKLDLSEKSIKRNRE